ncbi:MAG: carboxylate-amine ligase [Hyphomicrobiaceae bacterium]|nr:MAG: carboxylate-amine ligase [Hyphomicrobiaceae bacterium]
MSPTEPSFTLGIEEEYHLVDRETGELAPDPPRALLAECRAELGGQVSPEFLRSQIEAGTRVCQSIADIREDMKRLRTAIVRVTRRHGLAPIAASTHPFAEWAASRPTARPRYKALASDLQGVGRRLVICGMHVHVAIEDDELRIDLMNQARYFLPHLLALSTSSPFWQGADTGLKCYRLAVYNELPRTGLPGHMASWSEYQSTVEVLTRNGVIEDGSKIWWDIRPSARFPTLEMRITDVCTRLEDAISVAALYRCILRMLFRLRRDNQNWRQYPLFLLNENRWRAQRYGFSAGLFDFGRGSIIPFATLLDELIALVMPDAEHFGCVREVEHAREIVARGTSADAQLALFKAATQEGLDEPAALRGVVGALVETTAETGEAPLKRKAASRRR